MVKENNLLPPCALTKTLDSLFVCSCIWSFVFCLPVDVLALAKDLEIDRWICSGAEEPADADPCPRIHHRCAHLPSPGLQPVPHVDLELMQLSPGDRLGCACGNLATVTAMGGPAHSR